MGYKIIKVYENDTLNNYSNFDEFEKKHFSLLSYSIMNTLFIILHSNLI